MQINNINQETLFLIKDSNSIYFMITLSNKNSQLSKTNLTLYQQSII